MTFALNYANVCRTCLSENCNMKSVFNVENVLDQPAVLSDILMSCASIQILKGDGLPENLCINCVDEMNRAFLFRKLCERSDATLRQYINTLQPLTTNSEQNDFTYKIDKLESNQERVVDITTNFYIPEVDILEDKNDEKDSGDIYNDCSSSEVSNDNEDAVCKKRKVKKRKVKHKNELKLKKYTCKECDEVYLSLNEYKKHTNTIHKEILQCDMCGKVFKSKTLLKRHKTNHIQDSNENKDDLSEIRPQKNKTGIIKKRNLPRTCTICNKTFRFHSNLERHKLIHTGEKPYLCNVCGKGFAQLSYLKIHSFIHTGEKPYKCQMCERSFAAPGTLMTHIRTHTGERPHVCKICGKDFPQSGYLSAHIRTHTGEKPVECKVCHRRFNQSGRLIIHMRIHSGEKPYPCKDCGRSFAVKGTLKKHIRTHTGERPYICTVCGQAFAQSGTLTTHMKVHRPK